MSQSRLPRRARGFTLVEMLIGVSVAGVLSSVAYPSFHGAMAKSRRADALIALTKMQLAQERWRSEHRAYASTGQLGATPTTEGGHYRLEVVSADDSGYVLRATAQGAQLRDTGCRVLQLEAENVTPLRRSGNDERLANDVAQNRRCWGA